MGYTIRMDKERDTSAVHTINMFGGTTAVAKLCDIKPPSVSDWKISGIPKPWLGYFACLHYIHIESGKSYSDIAEQAKKQFNEVK